MSILTFTGRKEVITSVIKRREEGKRGRKGVWDCGLALDYNLNNEGKGQVVSFQGNLSLRKIGTANHLGSIAVVRLDLPQSQQVQKDAIIHPAI